MTASASAHNKVPNTTQRHSGDAPGHVRRARFSRPERSYRYPCGNGPSPSGAASYAALESPTVRDRVVQAALKLESEPCLLGRMNHPGFAGERFT